VVVGSTELQVDGGQPLEIVADIELIAHAHPAMDLHGLLADELCCLADLPICTFAAETALARSRGSRDSDSVAR
jgi:hypothetical protein